MELTGSIVQISYFRDKDQRLSIQQEAAPNSTMKETEEDKEWQLVYRHLLDVIHLTLMKNVVHNMVEAKLHWR